MPVAYSTTLLRIVTGSPMRSTSVALGPMLTLIGCGMAPSVNVLGSFFPAWLICIVLGLALAIVTRRLFVSARIAGDLGPAALIYPCLAALWTFAAWLVLFGG